VILLLLLQLLLWLLVRKHPHQALLQCLPM
jgi:hypothetical protein